MTNSGSVSFFLGANTPEGFHSLFSGLYFPELGWQLYIIKGGPGTGKSTLMKKIAAECDKRGLFCERIFCSSDPTSLDAVIIPSLKISIADGTSPHVIEPMYPGVAEKFIDLGQFRGDTLLAENRDEIIAGTKENSLCHKKCIDFLFAARGCENDTASVVIPTMKMAVLHRFAEKLAEIKLNSHSMPKGSLSGRFLSAFTPAGFVIFDNTFDALCEKKILLKDSFGCASSVILRVLAMKAAEKGIRGYICHSPLYPDHRPEQLIFPDLSLGFYVTDSRTAEKSEAVQFIDCMRFYDREALSRHKNRLAFNKRSRDEMLSAAIESLKKAKSVHDELEKYYISAMDFSAMKDYSDTLIREIFSRRPYDA